MSAPSTRPFDEPLESDARPSYPSALADHASNINQDNSVNKSLPYIWFNGVIAALALGLAIGAIFVANIKTEIVIDKIESLKDKTTVSENHWRNIETDVGILKKQSEVGKNGK